VSEPDSRTPGREGWESTRYRVTDIPLDAIDAPGLRARFEQKVDRALGWGKLVNGDWCHRWTGSHSGNAGWPYGAMKATLPGIGLTSLGAHRLAWAWHNKQAYPSRRLDVRHDCDNTLCVNPLHLKVGARKENLRDMVERGRNYLAKGERQRLSKLTYAGVEAIYALHGLGWTGVRIARALNISATRVCVVLKNVGWADHERFRHVLEVPEAVSA
jgi:hypothetical protein